MSRYRMWSGFSSNWFINPLRIADNQTVTSHYLHRSTKQTFNWNNKQSVNSIDVRTPTNRSNGLVNASRIIRMLRSFYLLSHFTFSMLDAIRSNPIACTMRITCTVAYSKIKINRYDSNFTFCLFFLFEHWFCWRPLSQANRSVSNRTFKCLCYPIQKNDNNQSMFYIVCCSFFLEFTRKTSSRRFSSIFFCLIDKLLYYFFFLLKVEFLQNSFQPKWTLEWNRNRYYVETVWARNHTTNNSFI